VDLAQAKLLKAKLDAAEKPEERIAVLEEHVKLATTIATETNNRWKAGVVHELEALDAKASLLDVKIRLLRERSKVKAPAK
jgi:outer membrane protein TolC